MGDPKGSMVGMPNPSKAGLANQQVQDPVVFGAQRGRPGIMNHEVEVGMRT